MEQCTNLSKESAPGAILAPLQWACASNQNVDRKRGGSKQSYDLLEFSCNQAEDVFLTKVFCWCSGGPRYVV